MTVAAKPTKLGIAEFIAQCHDVLIPVPGTSLAYFSAVPLDSPDQDHLINDPVSAFPPGLSKILPNLRLVYVPYLELGEPAPDGGSDVVISFQRPPEEIRRLSAFETVGDESFLFVSAGFGEEADIHEVLFGALAQQIVSSSDAPFVAPFHKLVSAELRNRVHGEVGDIAWDLKKSLLGPQADENERANLRKRYFEQALRDTVALYLHGLCCDIDLRANPKQLASKYIRKRLLVIKDHLPPPEGVGLFPSDLPG